MNNIVFKGIMPALITPYDSRGNVKKETVEKLVNFQLEAGVDGFYVCGGTGEGPVLSKDTRMQMTEAVVAANAGRGDVIVHVGSFNPNEAVELTRHAEKAGADGISSLPPTFYYNYTDDEIFEYYKNIAENTDLPVMMYATTAIKSKNINDLIISLMEIENIVGLKDTRRNYYQMWQAKQINGGNINVINGPDEMLICGLSMGADGGIGSSYNIIPEKFVALYKSFKEGDIESAQAMQTDINKIIEVLIKHGVNGIINSVKCTLEIDGLDVGSAAYPAKIYTEQQKAQLKYDMEKVGYVFGK